ncbi:MAG: TM0106 family RecB-like putative nuclease [Acidiferrobacterales bacterium]
MTVTAQDLYNYTKCAHRVYLDAHGNVTERGEASAFMRLLWEMGLQTEREYMAALGDAPYANLQLLSVDEACLHTDELMRDGTDLIYQGAIKTGDWVGRPDLLVKRTDTPSRFGDYYYEPMDIKAGKGWEERGGAKTRFKEHYAFQILFYREILKRVQGYVPPTARIINADKQIEEFDPGEFAESFQAALSEVEQLVAGRETSEPVLGSVCHQCHWYARCRRWVEGTHDPSGLYFIGKVKFDLKRVGLKNIYDIAAMKVDDYLKGPRKIARVGKDSLIRMKERARVRLQGKPAIRPGYVFPKTRLEIFFDIEDDPTRSLTYLFGFILREQSGPDKFRYFLARTPEEEEKAARDFWSFMAELGDAVFYVYSSKERTMLKHLMKRYALEESIFNRYVEREYDLYTDLVVKYSDWPTYSYGIKQIARLVGFKWRDPDPSGANSIAWYNEYLKDPSQQDILQRIISYNEDDCRAMIAIKEYFEAYTQGLPVDRG